MPAEGNLLKPHVILWVVSDPVGLMSAYIFF